MRRAGSSAGGGASSAGAGSVAARAGHWTLAAPASYEEEVKRSKFLAFAWPAASAAEALALVRAAEDPGATHNCFAWRIGTETRCARALMT